MPSTLYRIQISQQTAIGANVTGTIEVVTPHYLSGAPLDVEVHERTKRLADEIERAVTTAIATFGRPVI